MLLVFHMKFSISESLRLMAGNVTNQTLISGGVVIGVVGIVVVIFAWIYIHFLSRKKAILISRSMWIVALIRILASFSTTSLLRSLSGPYIGSLVINPLLYNMSELISILSSWDSSWWPDDTARLWSWNYSNYFQQILGQHQKKNIIVVFAESFEPKYSALNGSGLYDYLPQFDAIQADGIRYINFFAPGCVSESAHISFLQWLYPLDYGWVFQGQGYQQYEGYVEPLPHFLSNQWYDTTFISTATLDFLQQKDFLKKMGFQTLLWPEEFPWWSRYTFSAPPDEALYTRAMQFVYEKLATQKPFFLNLQTISTHLAWDSPYGKKEQDVWRYADDTFSGFYTKLRQTNFFDNGVLIVFGDHRVPVRALFEEKEMLWPTWPAHVLATVIGADISSHIVDERIIQPIDIHYSLKRMAAPLLVDVWTSYNDIFDTTSAINHPNSARDRWLFYCKYTSNEVNLIGYNSWDSLDQFYNHPAYDFVRFFQTFQLHNTIGTGHGEIVTGSLSSTGLMVIGHWGAPAYAPIDTMSGFITALRHGANALELDISYTKDGVNVVRHGPYPTASCSKGTNKKMIVEREYDAMRKDCKTDNNESILTFDEMLSLTKDIVPLYIVELKVDDSTRGKEQMDNAIDIARKHDLLDKVIFISYDSQVRRDLTVQKDVRSGRDMFLGDEYPTEKYMNFEYIMTPFAALQWDHLQKLLSFNKPIVTYTPLLPEDMAHVLDLPISGVMVDDIPLLLDVMKR